ncbi:hypothetical protein J7295_00959 [Nakaseomyces glabratus]|nr:hypothetical protein J7298_00956 [Nakaseomyces glabratus]KAH7606642.1 hypothetical protein J7295_00959 [Nakaseomyces glabratus]KAH7614784.1 hypothetical protein J7292_00935 [Nakaseomyces glabratus]
MKMYKLTLIIKQQISAIADVWHDKLHAYKVKCTPFRGFLRLWMLQQKRPPLAVVPHLLKFTPSIML